MKVISVASVPTVSLHSTVHCPTNLLSAHSLTLIKSTQRKFYAYDLNGTCVDKNCQAQHFRDFRLTKGEIYLDLLSYCPALLKTKEGKQVDKKDPIDVKIAAAEATVDRLCLNGGKVALSLEDTCKLLVNCINKALNKQLQRTTSTQHRRFLPVQSRNNTSNNDNSNDLSDTDSEDDGNNDQALSSDDEAPEERYYGESSLASLKLLEQRLEKDPSNEQLRIEFATAFCNQPAKDVAIKTKNIEITMHQLCLGIETNQTSELLWSAYLPFFYKHIKLIKGSITHSNMEDLQIVDQALRILPLSKPLWEEVLSWSWPVYRLNELYLHLTQNLIERDTMLENPYDNYDGFSQWLLEIAVERCHILYEANGKQSSREALLYIFKQLGEIKKKQKQDAATFLPLSQKHISALWLVYIHLAEFGRLPDSLFDDSYSQLRHGLCTGYRDIILPFSKERELVKHSNKLRTLFKGAIQACSITTMDTTTNYTACLPLYKSLICMEASLLQWNTVVAHCRRLIDNLKRCSNPDNTTTILSIYTLWIETLLQSDQTQLIDQAFTEALQEFPTEVKIVYLYAQYNFHNGNDNIALQRLRQSLSQFVEIETNDEDSDISTHKLVHCYEKLLDKETLHPDLKVDENIFNNNKAFLWLCYCLVYRNLPAVSHSAHHKKLMNLYESALEEGRNNTHTVWIEYLIYYRSTCTLLDIHTRDKPRNIIISARMSWYRTYLALLKRCLQTAPCVFYHQGKKFTDYSFHQKAVHIFLDCFKKEDLPMVDTILTDLMPSNIPILIKASKQLLKENDHVRLSALL